MSIGLFRLRVRLCERTEELASPRPLCMRHDEPVAENRSSHEEKDETYDYGHDCKQAIDPPQAAKRHNAEH